jgi:Mg-chelatase subunit ChlD
MYWTEPKAFLLLLPVGAALAVFAARLPRSVLHRYGFAAAAAVLLVGALASPRLSGREEVHHVVLLFDESASVRNLSPAAGLAWTEAELRSRLLSSDRLTVMAFARMPRVLREAAPAGRGPAVPAPSRPAEDGTDIARVLRAAARSVPNGADVILVTDGRPTCGDTQAARAELALTGAGLWVVPAGVAPLGDTGVETLTGPVRPGRGQRARIEATIFRGEAGWSVLTFLLGDSAFATRRLQFPGPGRRTVSCLTPPLPEGMVTLRAAVTAEEGNDPVPENDSMELPLRVHGASKVLYVASNPEGRVFPRILESIEGVNVETRPPFGLPRRPGPLAAWDVVVLDDVSAERLSPAASVALQAFVENLGGGLLLLGGEDAFGAGGHFDTPVEDLSPLRSRPDDARPVSLLVLLDASRSMAREERGVPKMTLAVRALLPLVDWLRPGDELCVLPFDEEPRTAAAFRLAGKSEGGRERLLAALGRAGPAGGTSIYRTLSRVLDYFPKNKGAARHVMLYSDGVETLAPGDYAPILKTLQKEEVTLSVVVTAPSLSPEVQAFLRGLVTGGRFYHVRKVSDLTTYFIDDTRKVRDLVARGRVPATVHDPGFGAFNPPTVEAYVRTGLKAEQGARLVLGAGKDPLLASWRKGLGRVWAFASTLEGNWAPEWLVGRRGMVPLWAEILADLKKRPHRQGAMDLTDRDGTLVFGLTLRRKGGFRNGLTLQCRVLRNLRVVATVSLAQTGPGRYQGSWPVPGPGHYTVSVMTGEALLAEGDIVVRRQAELRRLGPDMAFLRKIAGPGRMLDDVSQYRRPARGQGALRGQSLAWLAYVCALGAFFAHLVLRQRR